MTTAVQIPQPKAAVVGPNRARKLRVVLADGSDDYMKIVLALLELHERVDLIGRAANFTEATELVVNHGPDLLLLDLDMHLANLIAPAAVLSSRTQVKIVGLCIDSTNLFSTAGLHYWSECAGSQIPFPAGVLICDRCAVWI